MASLSSLLSLWLFFLLSNIKCKSRQMKPNNIMKVKLNANYNPTVMISTFSPELGIYFANLIGVSYCFQDKIAAGECCDSELDLLHWTRFDSNYTHIKQADESYLKDNSDYNIQILFSNEYKKILIMFPGTRLANECLNLIVNYASVPFNNSDTQKIFKHYDKMYQQIKPMVSIHLESFFSEQPQAKEYQIILLGHSLGGVLSTLFAYDAISTGMLPKKNFSPLIISYGQPRIGNSYLIDEINKTIPLIFRIVRKGDEITQMPFFAIECDKGDEECPDRTIYQYAHTKGLKMLNDEMTSIAQCNFKEDEVYENEECNNAFNLFKISEYHLYYFKDNRAINRNCPEVIEKKSNLMKPNKI